ncbi:MAG: 50S ribosomal protein L23 [Candidatus Cloacimonetes bacterium]|nr:50S ribosomal protein L23 [Candidatus Cloacimonadota bacterium]
MKHERQIIIAPLITEKTTALRNKDNSFTFVVSLNANKIEIKHAIERIFSVDVERVNTIQQRGKMRRVRRELGKRADWKKAIVTLRAGQNIPDFEM